MSSNLSSRIVLVTGANQGFGLGVIEVASLRDSNDIFSLCSRDLEKGHKAVQKLHDIRVTAKVDVIQLEVTNNQHITAAVNHVKNQYGRLDGKLDPESFVLLASQG